MGIRLPYFPHRHNADGSYDSICTTCFATVGSAQKEGELTFYELVHTCDEPRTRADKTTFCTFSQRESPHFPARRYQR